MLKATFAGGYGSDNLDGFENSSGTIAPKYCVDTENFKLSFGFDFVYDMRQDEDKTFFLPQAKILFNVGNGSFVPYASLDSRMVDNGYRSLTKRNPYLTQAGSLTSHYYDSSIGDAPLQEIILNSQEYNIRGGSYGCVSPVFS